MKKALARATFAITFYHSVAYTATTPPPPQTPVGRQRTSPKSFANPVPIDTCTNCVIGNQPFHTVYKGLDVRVGVSCYAHNYRAPAAGLVPSNWIRISISTGKDVLPYLFDIPASRAYSRR